MKSMVVIVMQKKYQSLHNANLPLIKWSYKVLLPCLDVPEHFVILDNLLVDLRWLFYYHNCHITYNSSIISISIGLLGDEVSHVGLVNHEEGDGDGLLPAEVRINVPEDEEVDELPVKCGSVDLGPVD